jgi:hypothetical protein
MSATPRHPRAAKVFYSYSHRDEAMHNELENHLSMLRREGVISSWHDRKIGAGKEWNGDINEHLDTSDIILLLVSSDFLASAYCYDVEMRRAMERHAAGSARVIPIILRACDWTRAPFSALQALPKDALPIKKWADRDEAFLDVAQGIRKAVEELAASSPAEKGPRARTTYSVKPAINPKYLYLAPYLCDRSEQEISLEETLREHPPHRPLVCVVHGDEQECHDMFLLRLLRITLPNLLRLKASQVLGERYAMPWPTRYTPSTDPLDLFRSSLVKVLGCDSRATREEMAHVLAREQEPVIIHSNLLTANWRRGGRKLIESFVECWRGWPDLPPGRILIVCLFIKYERGRERNFWEKWRLSRHNKQIQMFLRKVFFKRQGLTGVVLPELRAIPRADVEQWVHSYARRIRGDEFTADFFRTVGSIFADRDEIEMEELAAHLKEMLRRCPQG